VKEAAPQPLAGPPPEYPAKLRDAKLGGHAAVHLKISKTGRVSDLQVSSATDPAFGESALAAARQWRFLPRVVDGTPVESTAEMPFVFTADKP
jgi:TonB family protein